MLVFFLRETGNCVQKQILRTVNKVVGFILELECHARCFAPFSGGVFADFARPFGKGTGFREKSSKVVLGNVLVENHAV